MSEALRASGVFDDTETSLMCDAYEMAILALGLTHEVDDIVRTILADCIIRILKTESITAPEAQHNTSTLAARGVDRLLETYNSCISSDRRTLH